MKTDLQKVGGREASVNPVLLVEGRGFSSLLKIKQSTGPKLIYSCSSGLLFGFIELFY